MSSALWPEPRTPKPQPKRRNSRASPSPLPQVALILLGETVFGPLWVWVCYGDVPDNWTLSGGGLLLLTLISHEVAGMRSKAQAAAPIDAATQIAFPLGDDASSVGTASPPPLVLFNIGGYRSPLGERFRSEASLEQNNNSRSSSVEHEGPHDVEYEIGESLVAKGLDSKQQPLLSRRHDGGNGV